MISIITGTRLRYMPILLNIHEAMKRKEGCDYGSYENMQKVWKNLKEISTFMHLLQIEYVKREETGS